MTQRATCEPLASLPPDAAQVGRLIEKGNSKSAVELAKQVHKQAHNAASESLLVEAYLARIRSLREHRMEAEAVALEALVRERYPSSGARLDLAAGAMPESRSLEELVGPLGDPGISREQRTTIETALRRRLDDLSALAGCCELPADHPLRTGAAALETAFRAVTSGPVGEEEPALAEISHRSPLASWKMLVRAIACFYRQDDAACERYLQAIDAESAPARLVPALRALLSGRSDAQLEPAAQDLVAGVDGGVDTLRAALDSLEAVLASGKRPKIYAEIQKAVAACRQAAPDLLERLKQHISIRAVLKGLEPDRVRGAMDGPSLKGAYFWLLFARAVEDAREPVSVPACSLWEEFRVHAVQEGWFAEDGPELAALYLHMADLLERVPREELELTRQEFYEEFIGYGPYYSDQPASIRAAAAGHDAKDRYFLYPERLYERACAIDPRPEAFQRWMQWAEGERHWRQADQVAEAWRRALPADSRPLLHLMESAERRGAFQKAIAFIEQAERLDPLNPDVRRARLRLLVWGALRHLGQRKCHLAERELGVLESLPQAQEGGRAAVLAALRWIGCRISGDTQGAEQQLARASALLDSQATTLFLFSSLGSFSGLSSQESGLPDQIPIGPQESLAAAVARGCGLGDDLGISFGIPLEWEARLLGDLTQDGRRLDAPQLRSLAETALRRERGELAYAATAAGLARGGPAEARFLLLRAQALPPWESERRNDCLAAAAELARRNRDMALVDEAVELRRACGGILDLLCEPDDCGRSMLQKELNAVLKRERAAASFPKSPPARSRQRDWDEPLDDDEDSDDVPAFDALMDEFVRAFESLGKRKQKPKPGRSEGQDSLF